MIISRYSDFATELIRRLGVTNEATALAIVSWEEELTNEGYSSEDCAVCLRKITVKPPEYAGAQALHFRVTQLLEEARNARIQPTLPDRPTVPCNECDGTGLVSVPHLSRNGYLASVTCRCANGQWMYKCREHSKKRRMTSLDEYEARNPDWRNQMQAKASCNTDPRAVRTFNGLLDAIGRKDELKRITRSGHRRCTEKHA